MIQIYTMVYVHKINATVSILFDMLILKWVIAPDACQKLARLLLLFFFNPLHLNAG